jgi:hypothetical protein
MLPQMQPPNQDKKICDNKQPHQKIAKCDVVQLYFKCKKHPYNQVRDELDEEHHQSNRHESSKNEKPEELNRSVHSTNNNNKLNHRLSKFILLLTLNPRRNAYRLNT